MSKRLAYQGNKAIGAFAEVYGLLATSTRIPAATAIISPPSRPAAHPAASRDQPLFAREP